jgi:hypothetical protein
MKLLEGGNVFKDANGNPLTQRINKADVPATVAWVEKVTGLDFTSDVDPETKTPLRWLGSTGRAATSGDLDLAVDVNEVDKEQLAAKLTQFIQSQGQDPQEWVKKGGEVHLRVPIAGKPSNGFVQTDFMFFSNLDWGVFYYAGGEDSAYKGMNRNVLMSSIAKQLGLKVGANGMFSRATNQLVPNGMDPDYVAQTLLGPTATRKNLKNVESIYATLATDQQRDAKLADFREYLKREGLNEPMLREDDVGFLGRLRDRIVNQGMYALIEHEQKQHLAEAKNPRIPYIEDLVFQKGLAGVREALDIIKQTAENTKQYATIKWDGSPAVIFGRNDAGEFVLTDKAGATAVGYEGLARSPEQIAAIMAQRDQTAAAKGNKADRVQKLLPMYQELWPYLEAATPKNFRGYFKGDMLYSSTDPVQANAGLLLFQPNKMGGIPYRIPENSPLGQKIKDSKIGLAIHTYMDNPTGVEQPVTDPESKLKKVPGLMVTGATVDTLQNLKLDRKIMSELASYARGENAKALQGLLNPAELRALQITDLPSLMEDFINSLKGTDYSNATPQAFGEWLKTKVTPRKYNNIVEYLQSPRSNILGMSVAFAIWNKLHELKIDLQKQLDLQQPGQEGWVFSTPAGRAKVVSRTAGGFADPARKAAATK